MQELYACLYSVQIRAKEKKSCAWPYGLCDTPAGASPFNRSDAKHLMRPLYRKRKKKRALFSLVPKKLHGKTKKMSNE